MMTQPRDDSGFDDSSYSSSSRQQKSKEKYISERGDHYASRAKRKTFSETDDSDASEASRDHRRRVKSSCQRNDRRYERGDRRRDDRRYERDGRRHNDRYHERNDRRRDDRYHERGDRRRDDRYHGRDGWRNEHGGRRGRRHKCKPASSYTDSASPSESSSHAGRWGKRVERDSLSFVYRTLYGGRGRTRQRVHSSASSRSVTYSNNDRDPSECYAAADNSSNDYRHRSDRCTCHNGSNGSHYQRRRTTPRKGKKYSLYSCGTDVETNRSRDGDYPIPLNNEKDNLPSTLTKRIKHKADHNRETLQRPSGDYDVDNKRPSGRCDVSLQPPRITSPQHRFPRTERPQSESTSRSFGVESVDWRNRTVPREPHWPAAACKHQSAQSPPTPILPPHCEPHVLPAPRPKAKKSKHQSAKSPPPPLLPPHCEPHVLPAPRPKAKEKSASTAATTRKQQQIPNSLLPAWMQRQSAAENTDIDLDNMISQAAKKRSAELRQKISDMEISQENLAAIPLGLSGTNKILPNVAKLRRKLPGGGYD